MYRIKKYALVIAAIITAQFSAAANAKTTDQDSDSNNVLDRVAKIQHEAQLQEKTPEVLQNQKISQWYNWSNWQNWNNWFN